jgi:surface protein
MLGARAASRQKRNSFTSNWDTTQAGSANDTVDLKNGSRPLLNGGSYNFKVYWGDGTTDIITSYNQAELTHQYSSTGTYEIRIGGEIIEWYFNNAGDDDKIINISNWGPLVFDAFQNYVFYGCSNLDIIATDAPTLSGNSLEQFFLSCPNIGSNGDMYYWDTSNVTNMSRIFEGDTNFNQNVGGWDVSNNTNFFNTFINCNNFNNGGSPSISGWDTSSVTTMYQMFYGCDNFNQPIGSWDTSSVTNMRSMFYIYRRPRAFDQDIGNWDVSNVTDMYQMFSTNAGQYGEFNNGGSSSISGWDTSNVTNMDSMFLGNYLFNQPIGSWNTSNVTNMYQMFRECANFNQPLDGWDTSKVNTTMQSMFDNCTGFNQDIGDWDVTGVTSMYQMFRNCNSFNNGGSTGINNWRPSSCTTMFGMFTEATGFNQPIGDWDVSNVTDMQYMFYNYRKAYAFDQDIGNWDVGKVTNMRDMFSTNDGTPLAEFNNGGSPSISGWNTSSVTNMLNMFAGCYRFNQPLDDWDVTGVTDMYRMFKNNYLFNNGGSTGINNWRPSSCTRMQEMFDGCTGFNQPIGDWDTSSCTNMALMFRNCHSFNQPISSWDVSNVTNMNNMFYSTASPMPFNQDIGSWDVSKVTNMYRMFFDQYGGASHAFNNGGSDSIKDWNTSSLTNIQSMFESRPNPGAFNQPLTNWVVTGITTATNFLNKQTLSTTNYDSTLSGWHSQAVQNGVSISFGNSQYSTTTGLAFRNALVASGWTITDGGAV